MYNNNLRFSSVAFTVVVIKIKSNYFYTNPELKRVKEIGLEILFRKQSLPILSLLYYSNFYFQKHNRIKPTYFVVHLLLFSLIASNALVEKRLNRIKKNIIRQRKLAFASDNIQIRS